MPVISVDDHLIEPPDLFEHRLPAALAAGAPRVVEQEDGTQSWVFEGKHYPNVGLNAVVGRPRAEWSMEPARFDEMRPGCFDIDARVLDMDRAGIWASLCFPSLVSGFCGAVYSRATDKDLGLACLRAFNDWHLEVWAGTYPDRIIPLQLPWLADVEVAAAEVRTNAAPRLQGGQLPRIPGPVAVALHLQRRVGSLLRGLRGDRDRRVPAHGSVIVGSSALTGSAVRAVAHPVPRERPPRRRRMAVVGRAASFPGSPGGALRGRDRLGPDADGPGRLRPESFGVGQREHGLALGSAAERGAPAQLLVLLH